MSHSASATLSFHYNIIEVIRLYKRLRDLREDADMTQKQIASILHCAQRTYSGYECGTREIPITLLIKLAEFYKTTTDYILGVTNAR